MPMRVLFVEDESDLREMVGDVLTESGFQVDLAQDGAEALDLLREGRSYDVLVSDIRMPGGVSGIDVSAEAFRLMPTLPIILVSGHAKTQLPELPSFVEFLPKPYRLTQLIRLLHSKA
jgi:two-component system, cell cycle response regulator CpdR